MLAVLQEGSEWHFSVELSSVIEAGILDHLQIKWIADDKALQTFFDQNRNTLLDTIISGGTKVMKVPSRVLR